MIQEKYKKINYLTQNKVAEILNVKTACLNQWRCDKKVNIPYIKINNIILYPEEAFYNWLNSHTHNIEQA